MNCPRCDKALTEAQPEGLRPLLHCKSCDGYWLEQEDLKRAEETVDVRWWEFRHLPSDAVQAVPLDCPNCRAGVTMAKVKSERDRHVVMDVCPRCHGVWLDGGELEAIEQMGTVAALVDAVKFFLTAR